MKRVHRPPLPEPVTQLQLAVNNYIEDLPAEMYQELYSLLESQSLLHVTWTNPHLRETIVSYLSSDYQRRMNFIALQFQRWDMNASLSLPRFSEAAEAGRFPHMGRFLRFSVLAAQARHLFPAAPSAGEARAQFEKLVFELDYEGKYRPTVVLPWLATVIERARLFEQSKENPPPVTYMQLFWTLLENLQRLAPRTEYVRSTVFNRILTLWAMEDVNVVLAHLFTALNLEQMQGMDTQTHELRSNIASCIWSLVKYYKLKEPEWHRQREYYIKTSDPFDPFNPHKENKYFKVAAAPVTDPFAVTSENIYVDDLMDWFPGQMSYRIVNPNLDDDEADTERQRQDDRLVHEDANNVLNLALQQSLTVVPAWLQGSIFDAFFQQQLFVTDFSGSRWDPRRSYNWLNFTLHHENRSTRVRLYQTSVDAVHELPQSNVVIDLAQGGRKGSGFHRLQWNTTPTLEKKFSAQAGRGHLNRARTFLAETFNVFADLLGQVLALEQEKTSITLVCTAGFERSLMLFNVLGMGLSLLQAANVRAESLRELADMTDAFIVRTRRFQQPEEDDDDNSGIRSLVPQYIEALPGLFHNVLMVDDAEAQRRLTTTVLVEEEEDEEEEEKEEKMDLEKAFFSCLAQHVVVY